MPEWLEHRFGPSSRFTFGIITILSYIFINLAGVLFAGGLALHTIFGANLWLAIIALAVVAGVIFAGFLGIFLTLAVCFPGVIAYRLFPNLENPDQAYPKVVSHLIGPLGYGIRGLVFAALIGAIMSTIDSLVNSCSTVLTIDFYQRLLKPSATEREMIRVGRYTAAVVLAMGVAWTPIVGRWDTLFGYFQDCWFFMAVPIVVVFVSALLWPRSNNFSATATLLLCVPMTLLPAILKKLNVDANSFVLAGILIVPVAIFHIAMSYVRAAPEPAKVGQWIWKRHMLFLPAEEKAGPNPWYKNLLLWWILVAAAYVAIYIIFW